MRFAPYPDKAIGTIFQFQFQFQFQHFYLQFILILTKEKNMLNLLKCLKKSSLVFGFLFMAMFMLTGYSDEASAKEEELRKNIRKTVDEVQAHLPMKFDEYTILNKVEMTGDSRIVYTYYLNNISIEKQGINDFQIEEMENVSYEMVKTGVCTHADTKVMLDADGEFEYIYNDVDGNELMQFVITNADCK